MPLVDFSLLLNFILLLFILVFQRRTLQRWLKQLVVTWQQHRPRRWKPQSPHDCPHCQRGVQLHKLRSKVDLRPYAERKSRRGRKKHVYTRGFACPNLQCAYCGVPDDTFMPSSGMVRTTRFSASSAKPAPKSSPVASTPRSTT